jgi:hypothetical protein
MRAPLLTLLAAVLVALSPAPTIAADTKAPDLMNTQRPLFFSDLVPFDTERHRTLRLPAERKNFAFAAPANLLPLTFAEVGQALRHYPVVLIAEGDNLGLVALTGLGNSGNRFVDANGEWRAGAYIPAYVRGYPFIAVRPNEQTEPVLAFDPLAADFKHAGGQLLIGTDGTPSEQMKGIVAFQGEYRQLAERTLAMTHALKEAGVLEEGSLQLQAQDGGEAQRIGGFLVVSEAKLKALPAEALKKLMEADALGLAYAQLLSMVSLGNVFAEPANANTVPPAPTVTPDQPKAKPTRKQKAV